MVHIAVTRAQKVVMKWVRSMLKRYIIQEQLKKKHV